MMLYVTKDGICIFNGYVLFDTNEVSGIRRQFEAYVEAVAEALDEIDRFQDCMRYNCEDTGALVSASRRILRKIGRL